MTTKPSELRVVIFTGGGTSTAGRLITRIQNEVPEARVYGVLTERRPGKAGSQRVSSFLRNLRDPDFVRYVRTRFEKTGKTQLEKALTTFLHVVHGGRPPEGNKEELGCPLHVTEDYHGADALEFVRNLQPDLGIV